VEKKVSEARRGERGGGRLAEGKLGFFHVGKKSTAVIAVEKNTSPNEKNKSAMERNEP